ncbi:dihydrolipoyl dehydrogenase family protein [Sulfurisphaera ohwakuensis]|uniref:Dihydrolipoamide dehydrogenase n=1 Tax=Sulfurisphaera ohwakuensis TaxID=69656 RepID=A0A650CHG9_SULOH|nr:NAD(P)/FAD-dependent oxidoreductase [Sulfurisphaera ohwakuensis]MBB5252341.1 dihydrolipoamide dehydrogenase [Sulfurisphaera ohwakuensis]QGR17198.1 FAD-binding protein [Sulfurisphaera ohwakuensis]
MHYDVVIIGGGVGGLAAAIRSAELGKKVAIIEKNEIGGECINRACIPSKTLIDTAKIVNKILKSPWIATSAKINYNLMNKFKDNIIEGIKDNLYQVINKHKIDLLSGKGEVKNEGEVIVNGKVYTYENLVIATGSEPLSLADFPLNGKNVVDPWTAMNMTNLPENIIIVGGGVAGVELATLFRALNKNVTIIELMPRLLPVPGIDIEIANEVKKRLEEKGVRIYVNTKSRIIKSDDKVIFQAQTPSSNEEISGDLAVITIGRKPVTDGLDLKAIKVETDQRGYIKVDNRARTSNSKVYAVGDVAGAPLSATKAWRQGIVAGDNIGNRNSQMPKYIPTSIFADLEIGVVGSTLEELKKNGINGREVKVNMKEIPRAWTLNETEGFLKIVIGEDNRILGANMIGENATEVINTITLAMELSLKIDDLYKVQFSHPTVSEIITEVVQRAIVGEIY